VKAVTRTSKKGVTVDITVPNGTASAAKWRAVRKTGPAVRERVPSPLGTRLGTSRHAGGSLPGNEFRTHEEVSGRGAVEVHHEHVPSRVKGE
jgi:hypothetical protein